MLMLKAEDGHVLVKVQEVTRQRAGSLLAALALEIERNSDCAETLRTCGHGGGGVLRHLSDNA